MQSQKPSTTKSRHLSVHQLFDVLQEEYIVCEIRTKIYPIQSHKEYWSKLMESKKEKIINIAQRNNLFSIFDNPAIYTDFRRRIIPDIGYPSFIYKDDLQRLKQEKWDKHNYYLPKSEVRIHFSGETLIGIIETVDFVNQTARVKIKDGLVKNFNLDLITRIL